MENIKYGKRRGGRWTPIRAKAQDTRANPNSWETHLVRSDGTLDSYGHWAYGLWCWRLWGILIHKYIQMSYMHIHLFVINMHICVHAYTIGKTELVYKITGEIFCPYCKSQVKFQSCFSPEVSVKIFIAIAKFISLVVNHWFACFINFERDCFWKFSSV